MKNIIIAILVIISGNAFGQSDTIRVRLQGGAPISDPLKLNISDTAAMLAPYTKSGITSLTLSTAATTTGAATLVSGTLTIPIPKAETQTASGTAVTFSTVTVPNTYGAYTVYHNGVRLIPTTDYTTSGQIVTSAYFISGSTVTVETK